MKSKFDLQKYIRDEVGISRLKTHRVLARFAERGMITLEKSVTQAKLHLQTGLSKPTIRFMNRPFCRHKYSIVKCCKSNCPYGLLYDRHKDRQCICENFKEPNMYDSYFYCCSTWDVVSGDMYIVPKKTRKILTH